MCEGADCTPRTFCLIVQLRRAELEESAPDRPLLPVEVVKVLEEVCVALHTADLNNSVVLAIGSFEIAWQQATLSI